MKFNKVSSIAILTLCFVNILGLYYVNNKLNSLTNSNQKEVNIKLYDDELAYDRLEINGFTILINNEVPEGDRKLIEDALSKRTKNIAGRLSESSLNTIRKIWVWVEKNNSRGRIAEAHFSGEWLANNNFNPSKLGGIEISNIKAFVIALRNGEPNLLLHEFAHGFQYFHRMKSSEFDRKLEKTYRNAMDSGLYVSGKSIYNDKMTEAYARSNMKEYFSEITESYFDANDYEPFNREELKSYDPKGFQLAEKIWGK